MRRKIKLYYLIWLLFPATWFFFFRMDKSPAPNENETLFYTSIKAPKGCSINLFNGKTFMVNKIATGSSYNTVEYQGAIKYDDSLNIHISALSENDTVSFLSVNLFQNNIVYTLPENQFQFIKADSATACITNSQLLSYIPAKNSSKITIRFNNPLTWSNPGIVKFESGILILVFTLTIIALLIIQPSLKYLTLVTSLTCIFLAFYWWIGRDKGTLISIKNGTPMREVVFYHNSLPVFVPDMLNFYQGPDTAFRTQVDLALYPYYRISFKNNVQSVNEFSFNFSYGLISKSWNLEDVKPSEIIANDMDYNSKTSTWKITGNDTYFSLVTSCFIKSINMLQFLRKSLFLFISAFIFIIMLLLQPLLSHTATHKTLLISLFFAIIFNTLFLWFFNSDKLILDAEKRLAFNPPRHDSLSIKEYARRLCLYIQDQLPGRNNLIISNNYFKYETFGEIPGNPMVYFGKDRWMFYIGENVREIYENRFPLTPDQLKRMKDVLVGRRDFLRKQNIHYYIVFPRLPHFIYNEKIGSGLNIYGPKPKLIQLLEYLKQNTDLDVIDVETPILEAKAKYKQNIYYPNDSHWTLFGSYFAYREIINHIRKDFPNMPPPIPFDEIKWAETDDKDADLAQLICLNTIIKRHEYIPINDRVNDFKQIATPNYPEFQSIHPMLFYVSKDTLAPKLIMNRDSYTNFLIPYFATNFSRQGYLWTPIFYPTIIAKEKPDIVITEMLERFVYDLLKDTPTPGDSLHTVIQQGNAE